MLSLDGWREQRWSIELVWSYTASVTHPRITRTLLFAAAVAAGLTPAASAETVKSVPEAVSSSPKANAPLQTAKVPAVGSVVSADTKSPEVKGPDPAILRQGLVIVEQLNRPVAMGVVLAGDGRVLTALTPIGSGNSLSARYANGATKRLRVSASHRGMNLALLSPEDSRFIQGLRASRMAADDPAAHVRWLRGNQAGPGILSATGPLRRETLTGGDDFTLRVVFTGTFVPRATELGSALIDVNGDVVALISQACQSQPNGTCRSVPFAVPAAMLKDFLRNVPAGAVSPAPWIGIHVTDAEAGAIKAVRITAVDSRGPVAALGLRAGKDINSADLLVAIDGVAVGSSHAFEELLQRHRIGDRVRLLIFGDGRYREVTAVLGSEPARLAESSGNRSQDVGY